MTDVRPWINVPREGQQHGKYPPPNVVVEINIRIDGLARGSYTGRRWVNERGNTITNVVVQWRRM